MTHAHDDSDRRTDAPTTRRRLLALGAGGVAASLAGCAGVLTDDGNTEDGTNATPNDGGGAESLSIGSFRGSGGLVEGRPAPGGTSIQELPDLGGELKLYLGGGEGGLYVQLLNLLAEEYPDFSFSHTRGASSDLANTITQEAAAGSPQADLFLAVDAGALGAVAEAGAAASLPDAATEPVADAYRDDEGRWVGFAGRARAVPYNTETVSESEVPSTVREFPNFDPFRDSMGWAPSYGAFQSFVTAMRVIRGDEATKSWLQSMLDAGIAEYSNEWEVSNAVADGAITGGFANHYYALRVHEARDDAPLGLAFTDGDAGALVNVSGAQLLAGSERSELAGDLVRHFLSAEAQEFFATRTFAYPMIDGVEPVGDLPTVDELNPPDVDLGQLSDVGATVDLLREVGVL